MPIPTISDLEVSQKNVLVRVDLEGDLDSPRFLATKNVIEYLKLHGALRVKVIGHEGTIEMAAELGVDMNWDLRRDSREKENSEEYAQELAQGFDIYINEAFATSHRNHASIVALPKFMKSEGKPVAIGLRFVQELEVLGQVLARPGDKVLAIAGTKVEDKNRYARLLHDKFSFVLPGGLLEGSPLRKDGLDITPEAVEEYKRHIATAGTIVAAGVMGKYEDETSEYGTKEVLNAISESKAYKVAGGGDIEAAISKYGLSEKFDWISVGGGAMLEYLSTGTLMGLEAILEE
jgi:phosphoglycerate kinase